MDRLITASLYAKVPQNTDLKPRLHENEAKQVNCLDISNGREQFCTIPASALPNGSCPVNTITSAELLQDPSISNSGALGVMLGAEPLCAWKTDKQ